SGKLAAPDSPDKRLEVFVSGTEPKETISGQNNPPAATQTDQAERQAEKKSWWSNFKRWWME
ncbi:hypothetical protein, partial [Paenibacillus sp. 1-18]